MLIDAYELEKSVDPNGKETERVVLRFHPKVAPLQVAVFSLAAKQAAISRTRAFDRIITPREASDAV